MKKLGLLLIIFILSGCEDNYTVDYWNGHKNERNAYLSKCSNGEINRNSQNCETARKSLQRDNFSFDLKK